MKIVIVSVANKVGRDALKKLYILLFLSLVVSCSIKHENRLSGMYVSDKEATLKYLEDTGNYTAEHLDRIGKLLGQMKINYINNFAIIELDGEIHQEKFKIIEVSPNHTIIQYDLGCKYEIFFKGDDYWISGGIMPLPYMEKFKKMKSK